jgi:hypothetical protein
MLTPDWSVILATSTKLPDSDARLTGNSTIRIIYKEARYSIYTTRKYDVQIAIDDMPDNRCGNSSS